MSKKDRNRAVNSRKKLTFNEWVNFYNLKKLEYEFNLQNQMLSEFNLKQGDLSKILQHLE